MKLIKHMVLVDAEDSQKRYLLVNTINGRIDVLTEEETGLINKWKDLFELEGEIQGQTATELYQGLLDHGFLVHSDEEEEQLVEAEVAKGRSIHDRVTAGSHAATFVITYMCNYACPYCYESAITYEKRNILTKEMVDQV